MHHPRSAVANRVTISAGVATAENDACEEVLRRADVGLYAAKGGGRNMVFAIPAGQVPSVSAAETRREARSSDGKGAAADVRVLIVDDNATNRAICRIALQRAGYTVAEAVDGVHALAEVQRSAPDLILMDVAMPNMDGLECTKCLKEHPTTNEIPIIIVSAKADSADIVAGLQVGADEYITKPIRTDEVVLRVRSMARLFRERKELVRSYRIRGEQVRILHRLVEYCRCLGASQTMSEALQHICRAAVEIAVCRKAAVFLPDRAGDLLVMAESVGFHRVPSSMLAGQGVIGQVFSSGLPVIVNTNENQAGSAAADGRMLGPGPFVVVQIATGKEIMGVLALGDRAKGEPFGPHDLEHIELMAKIAASTLLGISSRVRDQEGCDAILMALAKLAEHRDSDTGRHVDRVTEYATMIAEELKRCGHFPEELDDEYIAGLRRAVPLHDIGKVAISDDILRKPGKLSESEMRIMRTHASIGAETIEAVMCRTPGVKFLQLAYDVVHGHHEWWDGSGYPRGLRGKEIPLAARITAVADVYDALTTKRVYKEAIAHDRAVAIITNLSGSQFDPMVIEAFLARERDFRALSPAEESVSAAAMQTAQSAL
jgi:putative two-component system response regulator